MKQTYFTRFYLLLTILLPNSFFSNLGYSQDTIPPVVYCLSGLITVPLPSTGCITIWAKDLDRGSYDNHTNQNNLKFYFDNKPSNLSITICCEDFVAAGAREELEVPVQMWVEDEAGNTSYCKTIIVVVDNQNICPFEPGGFYISGTISLPQSTHIHGDGFNGKITLDGPNGFHTEAIGSPYKFTNLSNGLYHLCIEKTDDFLNGITTADIVKIKRHILGLELMNSPYQLLASDLNRSGNLTAADVTELKKLILGISTKFSKSPNWIFVPADFMFAPNVFPDVNQFIPSCKTIEIKDKSQDKVDFIGIKMGNVN
jgi:hypothetical protein